MYRVARRQPCVARERAAGYGTAQPSVATAMAKIRDGLAELAAIDDTAMHDDELATAVLQAGDAITRLTAQESRLVGAFDRRGLARADACLNAASWLRHKTTLGPGASKRRVNRAKLLDRMPLLRDAFEEGAVRTEHVDMILYRSTAARAAAIADHDATLTELARKAEPRHVAVAVQRIVDAIDRDGADEPPPCETEQLRGLHQRDGYAGLDELTGTLTPILSEVLRLTRKLFDQPDPPDTPEDQRRTPSQRFHDALLAALIVALDNHPGARIGGVKTHVALFVDLFTLLGVDDLATIKPRLASGEGITPDLARHIIATTNPMMRAILGLGPWLPVAVGSARTLPNALRMASYLGQPICAAPGCDRPAWDCDIDHVEPHCRGGPTALCNSLPMCHSHNVLKHEDGWQVTFNVETGEVTWTSADGTKVITLPPPDI